MPSCANDLPRQADAVRPAIIISDEPGASYALTDFMDYERSGGGIDWMGEAYVMVKSGHLLPHEVNGEMRPPRLFTVAHEIGHALGLPHTGGSRGDYNNQMDVMSGPRDNALIGTSAINRYAAGWIDPEQVEVHVPGAYDGVPQRYELRPLGEGGTQMLVIPTRDGPGVFYALGARVKPDGCDLPNEELYECDIAEEGVEIYEVDQRGSSRDNWYGETLPECRRQRLVCWGWDRFTRPWSQTRHHWTQRETDDISHVYGVDDWQYFRQRYLADGSGRGLGSVTVVERTDNGFIVEVKDYVQEPVNQYDDDPIYISWGEETLTVVEDVKTLIVVEGDPSDETASRQWPAQPTATTKLTFSRPVPEDITLSIRPESGIWPWADANLDCPLLDQPANTHWAGDSDRGSSVDWHNGQRIDGNRVSPRFLDVPEGVMEVDVPVWWVADRRHERDEVFCITIPRPPGMFRWKDETRKVLPVIIKNDDQPVFVSWSDPISEPEGDPSDETTGEEWPSPTSVTAQLTFSIPVPEETTLKIVPLIPKPGEACPHPTLDENPNIIWADKEDFGHQTWVSRYHEDQSPPLLTIPAGVQTVDVPIRWTADREQEPDETFCMVIYRSFPGYFKWADETRRFLPVTLKDDDTPAPDDTDNTGQTTPIDTGIGEVDTGGGDNPADTDDEKEVNDDTGNGGEGDTGDEGVTPQTTPAGNDEGVDEEDMGGEGDGTPPETPPANTGDDGSGDEGVTPQTTPTNTDDDEEEGEGDMGGDTPADTDDEDDDGGDTGNGGEGDTGDEGGSGDADIPDTTPADTDDEDDDEGDTGNGGEGDTGDESGLGSGDENNPQTRPTGNEEGEGEGDTGGDTPADKDDEGEGVDDTGDGDDTPPEATPSNPSSETGRPTNPGGGGGGPTNPGGGGGGPTNPGGGGGGGPTNTGGGGGGPTNTGGGGGGPTNTGGGGGGPTNTGGGGGGPTNPGGGGGADRLILVAAVVAGRLIRAVAVVVCRLVRAVVLRRWIRGADLGSLWECFVMRTAVCIRPTLKCWPVGRSL